MPEKAVLNDQPHPIQKNAFLPSIYGTLLQVAESCNPTQNSSNSFAHAHVSVEDVSDLSFSQVYALALDPWLDSAFRRLDGLVEQKRLADVFYLGNRTLQIEGFREHNFEDLEDVSLLLYPVS